MVKQPPLPPTDDIRRVITAALAEDLGDAGDITTAATVPAGLRAQAKLIAKAEGVIAGLPLFCQVFTTLSHECRVSLHLSDGAIVAPGDLVAEIDGDARAILIAERTAINILAHLSGIATLTYRFVREIKGTGAKILDTRKTTPGLRTLEKYAVAAGGGVNHRIGLYDAFLIKENHIALAGGVGAAIHAARQYADKPVQLEVENEEQLREAIAAGVDSLLLDNMTPERTRAAVMLARSLNPRVVLESSGEIGLHNVLAYAEAGVDRISIGALTHSVTALDLSLRVSIPGI